MAQPQTPLKILIDTNVLFSAILFMKSDVAKAVFYANSHHEIYLTDQNISELQDVIKRKIPKKLPAIKEFLAKLSYIILSTTQDTTNLKIRDPKDQPISNNLDIILTGDKDFLALNLTHPKCMTVAEFRKIYMK